MDDKVLRQCDGVIFFEIKWYTVWMPDACIICGKREKEWGNADILIGVILQIL